MSEMKDFMDDKLNEECGVFGIYNSNNASNLVYYGLHALQHRGQEGCGIVVSNGKELKRIKGEGLVTAVFNNDNDIRDIISTSAITIYTPHIPGVPVFIRRIANEPNSNSFHIYSSHHL